VFGGVGFTNLSGPWNNQLFPIPGIFQTTLAAAANGSTRVAHARFLVLIIWVVVAFLGALVVLTILRILRRRSMARHSASIRSRSDGSMKPSPWQAAGQRAAPEPVSRSTDEEDDEEDDTDDSGEFPPLDDDGDDDGGSDDSGEFDSGPPNRFG